jgi:ATP-dependent DNA helicase DinG
MDRTELIAQFKKDRTGKWLLSPSVTHGEDFAHDVARCQILLKVPWPDLGDAVNRIRVKQNPDWYYWTTAQNLVQEIGRATRDAGDYSESWIVDAKFSIFIDGKGARFLPQAIRDALV